MASSRDRRKFLTDYPFRLAGRLFSNFKTGYKEAEKAQDFDRFFENYESSYALTLAYPDDILMETARINGIETEGKGKNEIVRELFKKKGGY